VICHMCGNETDFTCEHCGEPVCEECCVPFTLQNQIDFALCKCCHGENEERRADYYEAQEAEEKKREKEAEEKRTARRWAARKRYWLPENIEKRRRQKAERAELRQKQFIEAMKTISKFFG